MRVTDSRIVWQTPLARSLLSAYFANPETVAPDELLAWIAALRSQFGGRIVAVTEDIAAEAGRLRAAAESQGRPTEAVDALIAACAIAHGATVATRNASDFEPMGVPIINPWAS